MILLSVFLTWVTVSSFGTVELSLLRLAATAWEGIQIGFVSALIFVIFITPILVVVGGILTFLSMFQKPTKPLNWWQAKSPWEVMVGAFPIGGGILSLIGVGLFMLLVGTDPSVVGASFGLGVFVAILGSILVIASATLPKAKKNR